MKLDGNLALVTGAATRIGRSIALALAKEKVTVALHYHRSFNKAQSTLAELQQFSPNSFLVNADLSNIEESKSLVEQIRPLGRLSILVNNASLYPSIDGFKDFDLSQWNHLWNINVLAPLILSRAFFSNNESGVIINLIDAGLRKVDPKHFVYRLTKLSLKEMTQMLALELAPNVRVNAVGPGAILPPARMDATGKTVPPQGNEAWQRFDAYIDKRVPLKRPGSPEIIAENVLHLIKQDFLTGVILPVDGGEYI